MDTNWTPTTFARVLGDWSVSGDGPLFRRLATRIQTQIRAGRIPAGYRLPSERMLADSLGISRSTVVAALDMLRADGLITSKQGSGTRVTRAGMHGSPRGDHRLESFSASARPDEIDLRSAALPGLAFVADEFSALDRASVSSLVSSHGYIPGGLPELRTAIAGYYSEMGLPTTVDEILVTSGAQQALRILIETLLESGTPVLAEEPTFRGAIETLRSVGARIGPVPTGPRGIDVRALERVLSVSRARVLFVQASCSNPTGATMPGPAREELAELADRFGLLVIEDAAVSDAHLGREPLSRPLASYMKHSLSITIGSASKAFWGGLRVGWVRASSDLIGRLRSTKGAEDLGTSPIAQLVTARLLAQIDLARRIRRMELGTSLDTLTDALRELLPDWNPWPVSGGASLWAELPFGSSTSFAAHAARNGVQLLAGPTFSTIDGLDSFIRIAFACTPRDIEEGLQRMADAWQTYTSGAKALAHE